MNKVYFIFNTKDGYYLVESKDVDKIPKPRELIRRAVAVEVLREFAAKQGIVFSVDKARARTKHTEETKRKIGESNRGKVVTEETRKKMSIAFKGRVPWNKGKSGYTNKKKCNNV